MDFDDFNDDIQTGAPEAQDEDTVPLEQLEPLEQQPKKPKRAIKKRPKLTLEKLQAPNGLQEVFEKFPKWFQEGYKGKGHEVRDLRRLLELYQRWHPRLFNFCDYNQFETTLEKMSGTNALKVKLQDMRAKLPELVDPKAPEQEQQDDAGNQQQQQDKQQTGTVQPPRQQQQQQQQQQRQDDDLYDIDDDELMELQAQPVDFQVMDELMDEWEPPAAAAAAPAPTAASSQPAQQQHQQHRSSAGPSSSPVSAGQGMGRTAKRGMRDWSDDDDDEKPPSPQQQQPQQPQQKLQRTARHSNSTGSMDAADRMSEELQDAGMDLAGPAGAAAAAGVGAAASQPVRGRLRKRHVLDDGDSDGEGVRAAAAAVEDLEDELPDLLRSEPPSGVAGGVPGGQGTAAAAAATAAGEEDLEDEIDDLLRSEPHGVVGQRRAAGQGTAAATAAAGMKDIGNRFHDLQQTEPEAAVAGVVAGGMAADGDDVGEAAGHPGMRLEIGTEVGGNARQTFLLDDDDDD